MTTGIGIRYRVEHRTAYRYGAAMTDGYTVACLVPRPTALQRVVASTVELDPNPSESDSYLDAFGNLIHEFGVHELHRDVTITARSEVELSPSDDPLDGTPWEEVVVMPDGAEGDVAGAGAVAEESMARRAGRNRQLPSVPRHAWAAGRAAASPFA